MQRGFLSALLLTMLFFGCNRNPLKVDLRQVSYQLDFVRIDSVMFETDTAEFLGQLPLWRQTWPFFFGSGTNQFWMTQRRDVAQQKLYKDIRQVHGSFSKDKQRLENMLKHYYHYLPQKPSIKTVGYLSNLDFDFPVIFADTLMFLALDLYLGERHPAYVKLPNYLANNRKPEFIVRDAAEAIAQSLFVAPEPDRPFIEELVYRGQVLYAIKALMPEIEDEVLFRYSQDEISFCTNNERMVWNYFIDNELLFETSLDPKRRFIYPAPFSKFRTSFDNQTPGGIGHWIGFQIVNAYMERNNKDLTHLLAVREPLEIFKNSKYKPK
jgi:hypothetical protein